MEMKDITLQQSSERSSPVGLSWQDLYRWFLITVIYPNVWVAAGIASLVIFVEGVLALQVGWQPCLLIFSLALVPYNLDRVVDTFVQAIPDSKAQSFFRKPTPILIILTASLVAGALLFQAPQSVLIVSGGGIIPLIYGVPLFRLPCEGTWKWYRLKDIPGSKAWIVAGVITYAVVGVPLAYAQVGPDPSAWLVTLFVFVFVATNSHLFDIRDVVSDQKKGVFTLPLILGIRKTRLLFSLLNMLMLAALGSWEFIFRSVVIPYGVLVPTVLFNLVAIWRLHPETPRNVYNIGMDGSLFLPELLFAFSVM